MNEKSHIRLKFKESPAEIVAAVPAAKAAAKASPAAKAPKPRPPTVGTESLLVKCGHTIAFDLYANDSFRDQRRQKDASRDCPPCRQAHVQAEVLAHKERRATKAATKAVIKAATFGKSLKPRLPDGARFAATYDATQVQWAGTLTVEGLTFERSASSLNKLLHRLDDVYRAAMSAAAVVDQEPAVAAS